MEKYRVELQMAKDNEQLLKSKAAAIQMKFESTWNELQRADCELQKCTSDLQDSQKVNFIC